MLSMFIVEYLCVMKVVLLNRSKTI